MKPLTARLTYTALSGWSLEYVFSCIYAQHAVAAFMSMRGGVSFSLRAT